MSSQYMPDGFAQSSAVIKGDRYKHPRTLWLLSLCYSLFFAAFCAILASLTLYQTNYLHMDTDLAYSVFSAAMALLWILPLGGGYLAGQFGYINASRIGLILSMIGVACFCFHSVALMYLGLALFVVGNALATPAIWCLVDFCYAKDSVLREAGFTLFYLCFNVGGVAGIFAGGALATRYGFWLEFLIATFCSFAALLILHYCRKHITVSPGRSIAPQLSWGKWQLQVCLFFITIVATPLTFLLFKNVTINNVLMFILQIGMILLLFYFASLQPNRSARNKLIAFNFLGIISIVFWTLYSLEPSFLSVFIQTNVDTHFLGINIPASSYFAFDGVFVILVGLVLSRIWLVLDVKGKNPSLSLKFALSLIIIGLGFAFVAVATKLHGNTQLLPSYYIVIAYAIFATSELLVSPLGISMIGRLAPAGMEGLMMGYWQLSCGIGGVIAGYIAIAPHLPDQTLPLAQTNPVYIEVFLWSGLGAIIAGGIVLLFVRKLSHLMIEHQHVFPQL